VELSLSERSHLGAAVKASQSGESSPKLVPECKIQQQIQQNGGARRIRHEATVEKQMPGIS
jgi:hypothetical protein